LYINKVKVYNKKLLQTLTLFIYKCKILRNIYLYLKKKDFNLYKEYAFYPCIIL